MLLKKQNDMIRNRQSTPPVKVVALAHDFGLKVYPIIRSVQRYFRYDCKK